MTTPDLLDAQLAHAFERAHESPLWASPNWPDPVARLQRAAGRSRARRLTAVTVATAAIAGGAVAAARALPSSNDQVHYGPAAAGTAGQTGLQWLLTPSDFQAYAVAHPSPSPAPDLVPSPAPQDAELTQLQTDVAAALPAGTNTVRADAADGGVRGHANLWLRLPDGTPIAVERFRLDYPLVLSTTTDPNATAAVAPEHFTDAKTWGDATAYTIITGSFWGYGFDRDTQWNGPIVWTVTADGWFTMWTAPVSPEQLVTWARSADASFVGG